MPTPRQFATNAERQAAYRARQAAARSGGVRVPPSAPGARRWRALLGRARDLLAMVAAEMADYRADRSDAWLASERGEQVTEQIEALDEAIELLNELCLPTR